MRRWIRLLGVVLMGCVVPVQSVHAKDQENHELVVSNRQEGTILLRQVNGVVDFLVPLRSADVYKTICDDGVLSLVNTTTSTEVARWYWDAGHCPEEG